MDNLKPEIWRREREVRSDIPVRDQAAYYEFMNGGHDDRGVSSYYPRTMADLDKAMQARLAGVATCGVQVFTARMNALRPRFMQLMQEKYPKFPDGDFSSYEFGEGELGDIAKVLWDELTKYSQIK